MQFDNTKSGDHVEGRPDEPAARSILPIRAGSHPYAELGIL
jgi:hypothetical protein